MGEENTPGGTKGLVAAIERFEQARDELRQVTREAHAATKDARAVIAEIARLRADAFRELKDELADTSDTLVTLFLCEADQQKDDLLVSLEKFGVKTLAAVIDRRFDDRMALLAKELGVDMSTLSDETGAWR